MSLLKNSKFWSGLVLFASLASLAAILVPMLGVRGGWMSFRDATTYMRYAVYAGLFVAILAILVLLIFRKHIVTNLFALLLVAVPIGVIAINNPDQINPPAAPAQAGGGMAGAPAQGRAQPLNDISTDTQDPPLYSAVIPLRPEGSNTLDYPQQAPELQRQMFPDIEPIVSLLDSTAAFNRALDVADRMGWDIVFEDVSTGMIEAVATTGFFGFKDDVVIRVRSVQSGSIIDLRSHSRVGRGDRGKNAERVRAFIDAF